MDCRAEWTSVYCAYAALSHALSIAVEQPRLLARISRYIGCPRHAPYMNIIIIEKLTFNSQWGSRATLAPTMPASLLSSRNACYYRQHLYLGGYGREQDNIIIASSLVPFFSHAGSFARTSPYVGKRGTGDEAR